MQNATLVACLNMVEKFEIWYRITLVLINGQDNEQATLPSTYTLTHSLPYLFTFHNVPHTIPCHPAYQESWKYLVK